MFSSIKLFTKQSFIYSISSIARLLPGLILLPVYGKYLTAAEYGQYELLMVSVSLIGIFIQMGVGSAIFRSVIFKEGIDQRILISTSFYFLIISSTIILIPLMLISDDISHILFESISYSKTVVIMLFVTFLNNLPVIPLARFRINNQAFKYITINLFTLFAGVIITLYFLVILKMGFDGLIWATLLTSGLSAIVSTATIVGELRLCFSIKELKELLSFGLPLIPTGFAAMILSISDRYFLNYYSSAEELGVYAIGYKIASVVMLLISSTQTAWPSILFSVAKESYAKRFFSISLTYYLYIVCFIGAVVSVYSSDLLRIISSPEFYEAYKIIPLIVMSYIFYGVYLMTNVGLNVAKKTLYLMLIVLGASFLNLVLNFIFIPRLAMTGAAISTLISYIVMAVVSIRISINYFFVEYEYIRVLKIFAVIILIYCVNLLLGFDSTLSLLFVKGILLILYPIMLYVIGFYRPDELKKARYLIDMAMLKVRSSIT